MRFPKLLFLFFLFPLHSFSQGKIEAGFIAEHVQLDYRNMRSFGAQVYFPIAKRFTINYHFGIGPSSNGGRYVHATGGSAAGMWLLTNFNETTNEVDKFLHGLGIVLLFVPEGAGYYINPEAKWRMHVSLNPLGVEHWKRKKDGYYEETRMSCDLVFRIKRDLDERTWVAPHVGGKWIYRNGAFGGLIGVTLGFQGKE